MHRSEPDGVVDTYGGAVWRIGDEAGEVEVLLVHRPSYLDWSLPKGKMDPGESAESCALREVEEETGVHCEIGVELGTIRCVERNFTNESSLEKSVTVFSMRPISSTLRAPDDEVDRVSWKPLLEAREMCSCSGYTQILDALECVVRDDPERSLRNSRIS